MPVSENGLQRLSDDNATLSSLIIGRLKQSDRRPATRLLRDFTDSGGGSDIAVVSCRTRGLVAIPRLWNHASHHRLIPQLLTPDHGLPPKKSLSGVYKCVPAQN